MNELQEALESKEGAFWLAQKLEEVHRGHWHNKLELRAAAELRRQHAEIQNLRAALAALPLMAAIKGDDR